MNIEIFTMDETAANKNPEEPLETLVSEDGTEDGTSNEQEEFGSNENVCIQELDESRVSVVDQRKVFIGIFCIFILVSISFEWSIYSFRSVNLDQLNF